MVTAYTYIHMQMMKPMQHNSYMKEKQEIAVVGLIIIQINKSN
jgi:hypothetical protein